MMIARLLRLLQTDLICRDHISLSWESTFTKQRGILHDVGQRFNDFRSIWCSPAVRLAQSFLQKDPSVLGLDHHLPKIWSPGFFFGCFGGSCQPPSLPSLHSTRKSTWGGLRAGAAPKGWAGDRWVSYAEALLGSQWLQRTAAVLGGTPKPPGTDAESKSFARAVAFTSKAGAGTDGLGMTWETFLTGL